MSQAAGDPPKDREQFHPKSKSQQLRILATDSSLPAITISITVWDPSWPISVLGLSGHSNWLREGHMTQIGPIKSQTVVTKQWSGDTGDLSSPKGWRPLS